MSERVVADDEGSHHFGGEHTVIKLAALRAYLPSFTQALKNQPFRLHYIDAFAGTGLCNVKIGDRKLLVPGSASIAVACQPEFHRLVFIEKNLRKVQALERLRARAHGRDISIIHGEAAQALPACLAGMRSSDRATVFLDPFGMQVSWETLKIVASSRIADVLYLFPLSGLYRQATKDAAAIDDDKSNALTRILGTRDWYEAFYAPPPQIDLFNEQPSDVRVADVPQMLAFVKQRLESIFPGVLPAKVLRRQIERRGVVEDTGPPLFALFFAVSNPKPRALELAMRMARAILKV
jgi:three-Cys-motif partner protein